MLHVVTEICWLLRGWCGLFLSWRNVCRECCLMGGAQDSRYWKPNQMSCKKKTTNKTTKKLLKTTNNLITLKTLIIYSRDGIMWCLLFLIITNQSSNKNFPAAQCDIQTVQTDDHLCNSHLVQMQSVSLGVSGCMRLAFTLTHTQMHRNNLKACREARSDMVQKVATIPKLCHNSSLLTALHSVLVLGLFLVIQFVACFELEILNNTSTKLDIEKPLCINEMWVSASTSEPQFLRYYNNIRQTQNNVLTKGKTGTWTLHQK